MDLYYDYNYNKAIKAQQLPLKHWIHFLRSSLCPPTSNILQKKEKTHQSKAHRHDAWTGSKQALIRVTASPFFTKL